MSKKDAREIIAEAIRSFVTESQDDLYARAKQARDSLEADVSRHKAELSKFPKLENGLTPDHVRNSPDFKAHKQNFDIAFKRLQTFNQSFTKKFKSEIRADRDAARLKGK
jgi:hypothetical protein